MLSFVKDHLLLVSSLRFDGSKGNKRVVTKPKRDYRRVALSMRCLLHTTPSERGFFQSAVRLNIRSKYLQ